MVTGSPVDLDASGAAEKLGIGWVYRNRRPHHGGTGRLMFCRAPLSALRGDANSVSHAPSNANNRAIQSTAPLMHKRAPGIGLSSECHILTSLVRLPIGGR